MFNPAELASSGLHPFPAYAAMRAQSPVWRHPHNGLYNVFNYEEVERVLFEHAHFSSEGGKGDGPLGSSLISLDPPRHRQLRAIVSQAFTPKAIAGLAPRITSIAHELLDVASPKGSMDLIADFAVPLPVIVIAELLGIPANDREHFKVWSDAIVHGASVVNSPLLGPHWYHEMVAYFQEIFAQRQREPQDDLISALLAVQVDGEQLSMTELLGFCILLLIAGNETTTNLLGNAILCCDEYPETWELLRQQRELLPGAIEEVLRYRSPVQSMFRITKKAVTLGNVPVPEDSWVVAWIGSANRDEAHFPEPDRFDIQRTPNRHLAFGNGIHFCLGAPLARLEGRVALDTLLTRLHTLQIDHREPLQAIGGEIVFGAKRLPVTFTSA